jgi:oxygen-independent coproporphyrinogen-3 oxidase
MDLIFQVESGMVESRMQPVESLYVHVPFCARKCSYCAFYSEPTSGEVIDRYVAALSREMEMVASDLRPRTVFFGGGTPSLLNLRQWDQVLSTMDRLNLLGAEEWTIECNPATVSLDKARLLRSYGANRISMGVQSLNEGLLERLGRIHSREMVFKSFNVLRRAGFDNLNLDLMFAIPGQTLPVWRETLDEAIAMGSEHLSCYEVIYEEDTALYAQLKAGQFEEDEELACAMYDELVEQCEKTGLRRYEVANFARSNQRESEAESPEPDRNEPSADGSGHPASRLPTQACRHNVNYWRGGSFYGLGPSATGYVRGVRTKNWSNTPIYCDQIERGKRAIEFSEQLEPVARAGETAAFGLRMVAGWPFEQFRQVTGYDLRQSWAAEMERLNQVGLGRLSPEGFSLTPRGLRFADAAAEMFLR